MGIFSKLQEMFTSPAETTAEVTGQAKSREQNDAPSVNAAALMQALGGKDNLNDLKVIATTRIRANLVDRNKIDIDAAIQAGAQDIYISEAAVLHVIVGLKADSVLDKLLAL